MNVIQVVKPAIAGFVASEGGKMVIRTGKTIAKSVLKGLTAGGAIGGFAAGVHIGYKMSSKGIPAAMKPFVTAFDKMTEGTPEFTVTFHKETGETEVTTNNVEEPNQAEA